MSIVTVHGPNTMSGTGAGGGGTGASTTAPQVKATADMTNGLKFTFEATDTTRAAADYDWAFPGGTPATAADTKGPVAVTYATGGSKTATLTIAAGAGPPAGGAYPITVEALTAGPRMLQGEGGDGEEPRMLGTGDDGVLDVEEVPENGNGEEGPPPKSAVKSEWVDYVVANYEISREDAEALTKNELVNTYGENGGEVEPFDPGDYTVDEVVDYAEMNPGELEAIIADETAGKNRVTLISQLEALRDA